MLNIVLFLLIAFIASSVATVTGFGSATILTPFTGQIIDLKSAIVLVAFLHFFENVAKLSLMGKSINRQIVFIYGIPSIISAFIGASIVKSLDLNFIVTVFAIFLIFFSAYSLVNPKRSLPDKVVVLLSGGILAGFTAGVIGVGEQFVPCFCFRQF